MNAHEVMLMAVHWLRAPGEHAAILVTTDGIPRYWTSYRGAPDLAIPNLLQAALDVRQAAFVYSTSVPHPMSVGTALRRGVRAIFFLDQDGRAQRMRTTAESDVRTLPAAPVAVDEAGLGKTAAELTGSADAAGFDAAPWLTRARAQALTSADRDDFLRLFTDGCSALEIPEIAAPRFDCIGTAILLDRPLQRTDCSYLTELIYVHTCAAMISRRRELIGVARGLKNIAAILVSPGNGILSFGMSDRTDGTRHAETNCLRAYLAGYNDPIPEGSALYTNLRPCDMCAGWITTLGRGIRVVYGEVDRGIGATTLSLGVAGCSERRARRPLRIQARVNWAALRTMRRQLAQLARQPFGGVQSHLLPPGQIPLHLLGDPQQMTAFTAVRRFHQNTWPQNTIDRLEQLTAFRGFDRARRFLESLAADVAEMRDGDYFAFRQCMALLESGLPLYLRR